MWSFTNVSHCEYFVEIKKKEKKKKKKNAHIVSFDEDDSGTFSADPDQSEQSSKVMVGSSELSQKSMGKTVDETSELVSQISAVRINDNGSSDSGTLLSVNRTLQREASINSQTSYDRPPSVHSLSSTDLDLRYKDCQLPLFNHTTFEILKRLLSITQAILPLWLYRYFFINFDCNW